MHHDLRMYPCGRVVLLSCPVLLSLALLLPLAATPASKYHPTVVSSGPLLCCRDSCLFDWRCTHAYAHALLCCAVGAAGVRCQVFAPTVLENSDSTLGGETDDDASLTVEGSISTVRGCVVLLWPKQCYGSRVSADDRMNDKVNADLRYAVLICPCKLDCSLRIVITTMHSTTSEALLV